MITPRCSVSVTPHFTKVLYFTIGHELGPSLDSYAKYGVVGDIKKSLGTKDTEAITDREMEKLMTSLEKMKEIGVTPDKLFAVKNLGDILRMGKVPVFVLKK